jgi:hypothetical protein
MRRSLGTNRKLFLNIAILASAITLVSLAASGATASGRPSTPTSGGSSRQATDDIPTLAKKLADCRKDVALDREAVDYAESLLALAKRKQLVFIPTGPFVPHIITVKEGRDWLILQYVTGKITEAQLARELKNLAVRAAATLRKLTEILEEARDARDADQNRCAKIAEQLKQAQSGGGGGSGTFALVGAVKADGTEDVANPNAIELEITPAAMKATNDHKASLGGGVWKVNYAWELPKTLTPGKEASVTLRITIETNPGQNTFGVKVSAPGLSAQQLLTKDGASKTYEFTVPPGYEDAKELTIDIYLLSAKVTYHYRR